MAPLLLAGLSITFVVLVVRTSGIDIIPDTVGLSLYAVALWRIARGSPLFVVAAALAGVAAVVGLVNFAPHLLSAGAATDVALAYHVVVQLAIAAGAEAIGRRARASGDRIGRQFRVIAALAVLGLLLLVGAWGVSRSDHPLALSVLAVGQVISVATLIWYVVVLVLCAARQWAQEQVQTPAATRTALALPRRQAGADPPTTRGPT